ncbi:MAG: hypothetical protein AAGH90_05700 [Pseudomonadota bacterium]
MIDQVMTWCAALLQDAPVLAALAVFALGLCVIAFIWQISRFILWTARRLSWASRRQKRKNAHGFGIIVSALSGPKSKQVTDALVLILEKHIGAFTFGGSYDVIPTPALRAKGSMGLRDMAQKRQDELSGTLMVWGRTYKNSETSIDLMTREVDAETGYGTHQRFLLPQDLSDLTAEQERAVAYLFARSFQPGLADAVGFRIEKIKPVAELLEAALEDPGSLPPDTVESIEDDFCTMALHVGDYEDLEYVIQLRRGRLLSDTQLSRRTQIKARVDLGRALVGASKRQHNPARIREAMDHLKQAIELLREHPAIGLATATSDAVRQGEKMLMAKRRFSVTGGSAI